MELSFAVIEDDRVIADGIAAHLHLALAARVESFATASAARAALPSADLVVLDLNLPDSDGMQTLRMVRSAAPGALVIVVTARGAVSDRVQGLRLGADDYLVKPFSLEELEARIEALLRRRPGQRRAGTSDLCWDQAARIVSRGPEDLPLTPLEYEVFCALAARPGQALSREELLRQVIGPNFYGYERVIDVHVGHLRKKLDPKSPYRYVATVRHYGYRWDGAQPQEAPDAR